MRMRAATLFKSCRTCFKFYCMFYFTCDRSLTGGLADRGRCALRTLFLVMTCYHCTWCRAWPFSPAQYRDSDNDHERSHIYDDILQFACGSVNKRWIVLFTQELLFHVCVEYLLYWTCSWQLDSAEQISSERRGRLVDTHWHWSIAGLSPVTPSQLC